jgi:rubrerythrin
MKPTPEALKAIETAIQVEKDGLAFYTDAARQIADPGGKRMFESLAADEAAHLSLFETVRKSLLEEDRWLPPEQVASMSPSRFARPPIFPAAGQAGAAKIPERQLAALRRGIQAEDESIALYSEQMDRVDDVDGKAMYGYLVEQENGHRTILQGEYDYLTGTGFWFDVREFDLEAPG